MKLFVLLVFTSGLLYAQTPPPAAAPKPAPTKNTNLEKKLKADDTSGRREFSDEELEKQFFKGNASKQGNKEEHTQIFVPVFYEKMDQPMARIVSQVTNQVIGQAEAFVDGKALLIILEELVASEWLSKYPASSLQCQTLSTVQNTEPNTEPICWVNVNTFKDPDVKIVFNEKLLELRISVPAELRTKKTSSLLYSGFISNDETTNKPNWFSSYLNFNLSQNFRSNAVEYKNGREPLTGYYSSGTRFGGVVVEANGRSAEKFKEVPSNQPAFIREDVRAVIDFPSWGDRSQIGDLTYPVRSFQVYRPMAGVTLFTQQSLQSTLTSLPSGSYDLFLKRPSRVAVFINDQPVQTINLPAGRHNLRDFPFSVGLNDLRLEITDDVGVTETQNYTYFSSSELLKEGQHEISYAAGSPWTENEGNREYDSKNATFSGYHRYGYSSYLSLGVNFQTDSYQSVAGTEFLFSTPIGYFSVDPAYSRNLDHADGIAARIRYILQDTSTKEQNNRFTSFELSHYSEGFSQLGVRDPVNPISVKFQVNHSRTLTSKANLSLGFSYNFNRKLNDLVSDSYSISAGTAQRWFDGFSTNLSLRHSKVSTGREEITTLLFLIWTFPKERQYVTASSESQTNTSRIDWAYQPYSGVGGLASKVNVQNKKDGPAYGQSLDYNGNRVRITEAHQVEIIREDLTTAPPTPQRSVHTTSLQMGTAVVFAGGNFGITRPVTDSFAILVPLKNVDGQNILVNQQKDGTYIAETDWLGSAVLPELPSYSPSSIQLSQKDKSANGLSLPQDHFDVNPSYKSGYAIKIGSNATVYLKTTLQKEDNTPVSLVAGQAYYLDDTSVPPVTVFTNKNGLVRSEGFYHGRYRLEITESNYEPIEFTIPEDAPNEFQLPNLKLKEKK